MYAKILSVAVGILAVALGGCQKVKMLSGTVVDFPQYDKMVVQLVDSETGAPTNVHVSFEISGIPTELVDQAAPDATREQQLVDVLLGLYRGKAVHAALLPSEPSQSDFVAIRVLLDGRPYAVALDSALKKRVERYEHCNPRHYCEDVLGNL